jgi:SH3-like domain-containing protein
MRSEMLAPTNKALLLAAMATVFLLAACDRPGEAVCDTPSLQPVPRFLSLEYNEINARNGPGEDHRILWTWYARGMPVEVIAETSDWRRVRGPDGAAGWVHKRGLIGTQAVMRVKPGQVALLAEPREGARVVAWLNPKAVATLETAEGDWRKVKAGGRKGWVKASEVWGAGGPTPCRPREH